MIKHRLLPAVGLLLFCSVLALAGCTPKTKPGNSAAPPPAANTPAAQSESPAPPFVANPPRRAEIPDTLEIRVSISYGKCRFPLADPEALSRHLVEVLNRKLERFGLRVALAQESADASSTAAAAELSLKYSERADREWLVSPSGDDSKSYTPTECRLQMEMTAPWLSETWQTTISSEFMLGQATRPLNSDQDLRDMSLEELDQELFKMALPVAESYKAVAPAESVAIGIPYSGVGLAQRDNLVAVADPDIDRNRLYIYRTEKGAKPKLVASDSGPFSGYPLFIENGLLAACTEHGKLELFQCSAEGKLKSLSTIKVGSEDPNTSFSYSLAYQNNRLYLCGLNRLQALDISNPDNPALLPSLNIETAGYQISLLRPNIICAASAYGLELFRVQEDAFSKLGSFDTSASYSDVFSGVNLAIDGKYAYLLHGPESSVICIDLSDPAQPVEAGRIYTSGCPMDLAIAGKRLLVADSSGGICVVDLSPQVPQILGWVAVGKYAEYVACGEDYFACLVQSAPPSLQAVMKLVVVYFE